MNTQRPETLQKEFEILDVIGDTDAGTVLRALLARMFQDTDPEAHDALLGDMVHAIAVFIVRRAVETENTMATLAFYEQICSSIKSAVLLQGDAYTGGGNDRAVH